MSAYPSLRRAIVLMATLGLLVTATAPSALATFPGHNGLLAVPDDHDGYVVGVLRIAPTGRPQNALRAGLFTGCAEDTDPFVCTPQGTTAPLFGRASFSRDGHELVIGGGRLALLTNNGTGLTMLPRLTWFDDDPSFFPGGAVVAFDGALSTKQAPGTGEYVSRGIFTVRTDGTEPKQLTADGFYPEVSPTGGWIAYNRNGPRHRVDLWLMRSSGSGQHLLATNAEYPSFSPDGRHLAFASVEHGASVIERIDLTGNGRRSLVRGGSYPAWSPDGRLIAYTHNTVFGGQPDESDLWLIPASGGKRRRLAYDNPVSEDTPSFYVPAWQPLPG